MYTKFGTYQFKAYQYAQQEYLAIMGRNFFNLKNPIVYVHSESNVCYPSQHAMCYCTNQLSLILRMIYKDGGLIIYHSTHSKSIDGLLYELKARKLDTKENITTKAGINSELKVCEKEYRALAFIFKDLELSNITLVANDPKIIDVAQKLNIEIIKHVSSVTFGYGDR